jgi:CBS domain-containing membrane protein
MLTVRDIMTSDVFTLQEFDNLQSARAMMGLARIRHIPIVNDRGEFVGLLTHRDLLNATLSRFAEVDDTTRREINIGIPLNEVMRDDVRTVSPETPAHEAARLLYHHKYGCLPVLRNRKIVGIVTEADFLLLTIRLLDQCGKDVTL